MPAEEVLASLIACLAHDVSHPGFNNNFMINSRDEISVIFNDRSVLESMHSSITFMIMKEE